jgi:deoxyadenosine/deoxycytidine kinase
MPNSCVCHFKNMTVDSKTTMNVITISGNIGCGKTTCMELLIAEKGLPEGTSIFLEPIEKWGSWIDLFYTNQEKYAFPFQMKILKDFLYFKQHHEYSLNITERSPLDSLHVFSKMLLDTNKLTHMEHNLFKEFVDEIGWTPTTFIYIKTDPAICHERLLKRNRTCETGVTLSYLQDIHDTYESFVNEIAPRFYPKMDLHVFDGNRPVMEVYNDIYMFISNKNDKKNS